MENILKKSYKMFINGKWIDSSNGVIVKSYAPYNNELLSEFPDASESDIDFAKKYDDILKNSDNKKISAFLTIEEGEAIEGSIEKLEHFYKRGVRMMTLTWNFENSIGFGNKRIIKNGEFAGYVPDTENGLKPFGFEVVEKMEELGMIVDVSHMSDAGIYDIIDMSKRPFVASHSNAREVCNHARNLTDDMIKKMADKGCISGLNFYPEFLSTDFSKRERKAYIKDAVEMLKYMVKAEVSLLHSVPTMTALMILLSGRTLQGRRI